METIEGYFRQSEQRHGPETDLLVQRIGNNATIYAVHSLSNAAGILNELGQESARMVRPLDWGISDCPSDLIPNSVVKLRLRSGVQNVGSVVRFQRMNGDEIDLASPSPIYLVRPERLTFEARFDTDRETQITRRIQTEMTILQQQNAQRTGRLVPRGCSFDQYARAIERCNPYRFVLGIDIEGEAVTFRTHPYARHPSADEPHPVLYTDDPASRLGDAIGAQFLARSHPVVAHNPVGEVLPKCSTHDKLTQPESIEGVSSTLRRLLTVHNREAEYRLPILCVLTHPREVLSDNNYLSTLSGSPRVVYVCMGGTPSDATRNALGPWAVLLFVENDELYRMTTRSHPAFSIGQRNGWLRLPSD